MENDATNTSAAASATVTMQDVSEETLDSLQLVSIEFQTKPPNLKRNASTQVKPRTGTKGKFSNLLILLTISIIENAQESK